MDRFDKTAMRAAMLIHEHLAASSASRFSSALPSYTWQAVVEHERKIQCAVRHGWHRAARQLLESLRDLLDRFQQQIGTVCCAVMDDARRPAAPSPWEVYCDLLAIRDEFDEVEIDLKGHAISITTDRIILEGIRLGRFQVRLDWTALTEAKSYRVIALDSNPAATNEDVTHPHVLDESLCEGEGRTAIRSARNQARLLDFFLLVSQLLHTYGRGSAYVELENWEGKPCASCGASTSENDRYYCHGCDDLLCEGCSITCTVCCESHCSGCLTTCSVCDDDCCPDCRRACSRCRKTACRNCLDGGLCSRCRDELQEKDDHDPRSMDHSSDGDELSGAATEPHDVGETVACA